MSNHTPPHVASHSLYPRPLPYLASHSLYPRPLPLPAASHLPQPFLLAECIGRLLQLQLQSRLQLQLWLR